VPTTCPAINESSESIESSTTPPSGVLPKNNSPQAVKKRIAEASQAFQDRQDTNGVDSAFVKLPVYQGRILTAFYRASGIPVPRTAKLLKQAAVAAETIYQEIGSADRAEALLRRFFKRRADGHPDTQFTVHGPWSVLGAVLALSGEASGQTAGRVTLAELEGRT
jgi:hypothetical protein